MGRGRAIGSQALDVGGRLRILEGTLRSTFLWDAAEPLAAAPLFANGKYWENKQAKGTAHAEGNVK